MQNPLWAFHTFTVVSQLALITVNKIKKKERRTFNHIFQEKYQFWTWITISSATTENYVINPIVMMFHTLYVRILCICGIWAPYPDNCVSTYSQKKRKNFLNKSKTKKHTKLDFYKPAEYKRPLFWSNCNAFTPFLCLFSSASRITKDTFWHLKVIFD